MAYRQRAIPGQRYIPKHNTPELDIQKDICAMLRTDYPDVMFQSDIISGLGLRVDDPRDMKILGLMKALNSNHKHCDLKIFEKSYDGKYNGLALEIKKDGTTVILKIGPNKGKLTSDPHIREQAAALRYLKERGWCVAFGSGFIECNKILRWYLGPPKQSNLFEF